MYLRDGYKDYNRRIVQVLIRTFEIHFRAAESDRSRTSTLLFLRNVYLISDEGVETRFLVSCFAWNWHPKRNSPVIDLSSLVPLSKGEISRVSIFTVRRKACLDDHRLRSVSNSASRRLDGRHVGPFEEIGQVTAATSRLPPIYLASRWRIEKERIGGRDYENFIARSEKR